LRVIVDTPIWSYALRSKHKGYEKHIEEFENLISDHKGIIAWPDKTRSFIRLQRQEEI